MFGIYVHEDSTIRYAHMITLGIKSIETRNKNMLKPLIGRRVAIVRTRPNENPLVIGYAFIKKAFYCSAANFEKYRKQTCIPFGSKYDVKPDSGKWMYVLDNNKACKPYELPEDTIKHGRSYCEFTVPEKEKLENKTLYFGDIMGLDAAIIPTTNGYYHVFRSEYNIPIRFKSFLKAYRFLHRRYYELIDVG